MPRVCRIRVCRVPSSQFYIIDIQFLGLFRLNGQRIVILYHSYGSTRGTIIINPFCVFHCQTHTAHGGRCTKLVVLQVFQRAFIVHGIIRYRMKQDTASDTCGILSVNIAEQRTPYIFICCTECACGCGRTYGADKCSVRHGIVPSGILFINSDHILCQIDFYLIRIFCCLRHLRYAHKQKKRHKQQ